MLNFLSEPRRRNTFNQFLTSFRRIFNPISSNDRKNKNTGKGKSPHSKSNKLIEECKNSKVHPTVTEKPIEINSNQLSIVSQQKMNEDCPICFLTLPKESKQLDCGHLSCDSCLIKYLKIEISESRINITCPECQILIHPNRIEELLSNDQHYLKKYEEFMIRKVLITDSDTRYCPTPDCSYAVIATDCSKCPILKCGREECKTLFCYNCQKKCIETHKCKAFPRNSTKNKKSTKKSRKKSKCPKENLLLNFKIDNEQFNDEVNRNETYHLSTDDIKTNSEISSESEIETSLKTSEFLNQFNMKPCPACGILIIKIEDGSCNHMTCSVCGCQFCWLCIKKTSELHYLTPSGCTFFAKRQWSKKKKLFWQLGMLLGAPVFIALSAAIAIPSIVIGVPVWFGRKLQNKLSAKKLGKFKKLLIVTSGVVSSAIISPVLAAGAVAIGVPFLLAYVYGIVPITLCRSKTQMNDLKDSPMKISAEEAQAFLKQFEPVNESISNEKSKKTISKRSSKDKESCMKPKDKMLNKSPKHNSTKSIQNQSTKVSKKSKNEFMDFELNFVETNLKLNSSKESFSSASSMQVIGSKKAFKDEFKIVEVHCDRFGKLNRNKKFEAKSLEDLSNFCEICYTSHMKKIVHRPCIPCCPNF